MDLQATCAYNGTLVVPFGTRPGAYTARTPPVPVQAGVPVTVRLTDLKRNTTYYCNPTWSGVVPATAPNPSQPGSSQYGELSARVL